VLFVYDLCRHNLQHSQKLMMLRRELQFAGATLRPNSDEDDSPGKYILKFESEKVSGIKFTFLIVVPVNLTEIGIMRWCAHLEVLDYRLPRSHPIAVVTIKECYVYCGDVDYMTEDEMINLPSELTPAEVRPWSPGLLRERLMSRGQATWLRKVKNLKLTVPRRFNVVDLASNGPYFHCSADF
jgi:hypothetical protein